MSIKQNEEILAKTLEKGLNDVVSDGTREPAHSQRAA